MEKTSYKGSHVTFYYLTLKIFIGFINRVNLKLLIWNVLSPWTPIWEVPLEKMRWVPYKYAPTDIIQGWPGWKKGNAMHTWNNSWCESLEGNVQVYWYTLRPQRRGLITLNQSIVHCICWEKTNKITPNLKLRSSRS